MGTFSTLPTQAPTKGYPLGQSPSYLALFSYKTKLVTLGMNIDKQRNFDKYG